LVEKNKFFGCERILMFYVCELCKFTTFRKEIIEKHLLQKHKNRIINAERCFFKNVNINLFCLSDFYNEYEEEKL